MRVIFVPSAVWILRYVLEYDLDTFSIQNVIQFEIRFRYDSNTKKYGVHATATRYAIGSTSSRCNAIACFAKARHHISMPSQTPKMAPRKDLVFRATLHM